VDLQTGLLMLVTAELRKGGAEHERISRRRLLHRAARAVASTYRAMRELRAATRVATGAEQLGG
jgi:hypothetical protein